MELDFEFELSKGKQNSLGETLKVVEHIPVSYTHLTLPTSCCV